MRAAWVLAPLAMAACVTTGARLERNKDVARRAFSEILEKGRFELVSEFYAPGFRNGRATLEEDMAALRVLQQASPPDATMRPELLVAEGDYVAILWTMRGTIAGRGESLRGITIWKILDGKIREEWSEFDEGALERGLGLPSEGGFAR